LVQVKLQHTSQSLENIATDRHFLRGFGLLQILAAGTL
jgi:hypothetical protein